MRKIIIVSMLAFASFVGFSQTYIRTDENKSFNFVAPSGASANYVALFPAAELQSKTPGATIAVTVKQFYTFVSLTDTMSAATTFNLTINSQLTKGAILQVSAKSGLVARTITWGTGLTSTSTAGTISKTKSATFIYNGTSFVPIGTPIQID